MTTMNILTASQFIAQGTTAGAIMSIAAHPEQPRNVAEHLCAVAREVAALTGQSLAIPGAVTDARQRARWASNDNKRHGRDSGQPRKRRAA